MRTGNVVIIDFPTGEDAATALERLRQLDGDGSITLRNAAIVHRARDGFISVVESPRPALDDTVAGGLVGALVGIIGGPLGMLLGWTTGTLAGISADLSDARRARSILETIGEAITPESTAVIAEVAEDDPGLIDAALGAPVLRRPTVEVVAEVEAADAARNAARSEASRVLRGIRRSRGDDR